jgi:HPt (histidine-containing phosphotransfer) domain-containing protein
MREESQKTPVFDKAEQLRRLDGDEDLFQEVVQAFLEDIPHKLSSLNDYLNNKDHLSVGRQAHSIKGAAGNVGAISVRKVAADLEAAGYNADWELIQSLSYELQQELERFKEALF